MQVLSGFGKVASGIRFGKVKFLEETDNSNTNNEEKAFQRGDSLIVDNAESLRSFMYGLPP